jgi:hypothetical protein
MASSKVERNIYIIHEWTHTHRLGTDLASELDISPQRIQQILNENGLTRKDRLPKKVKTRSVSGCTHPIYALGLCSRHYRKNQRWGDPLGGKTYNAQPKLCTIETCENRCHAKGLCWTHYNQSSLQRKISNYLRNRLDRAIQEKQRAGSAVNDLGCSINEFKDYIESKFELGMLWENWGEWHLDHIRPLASFDLTNKEHFLEACHYTNYQPLWAYDNIIKSNKYSA